MSFVKYLPLHVKRGAERRARRQIIRTKNAADFCKPLSRTQTSQKKVNTNTRTKKRKSSVTQSIDLNEYNIFHIDSKIRQMLEEKIQTLPQLYEELRNAITEMQKTGDTNRSSHTEISLLRKSIQNLETSFELGFYIMRTQHLLNEYKKTMVTQSFIKKDTLVQTKRKKLESEYLLIAREYISLKNFRVLQSRMKCDCGESDFSVDSENSIYICKHCGIETELLDESPSFNDTDRVNMCSRYTYTKKGHFIKAMEMFQGTQNTDPKKIAFVVDRLKCEMDLHNLTPETVTKDQIYIFLSDDKKLAGHYDDINLLYHIITGKECPDISHLTNDLLDLFDKQEAAYEKVKDPSRVNSQNVQYKLYKLLQKVGYNCERSDFYFLKTPAKATEHDMKAKAAWKILGWKWIPT